MKRIAVTATGGGVGKSIIKSLKGSGYTIIALDSEPTGAGLYMANEGYLIPYASDDEYIPFLLELCREKQIDMLFPGMDCELMKLSKAKELFWELGVRIIISVHDVINHADDKAMTQDFLKYKNLPYLKTVTNCQEMNQWPCGKCVVKPRTGGARSKNVRVHKNWSEIDYNLDGMVIQEYIEGDEYTCGTLTLEGVYYGCIVMRRILRDGDTYKAFVEHNEAIEGLCKRICEALKPEGVFNIQLRLRDGIPYVFEFNARCSGTTAARSLAGFNEPRMIADYYFKGIKPEFDIKKITILRYWNELPLDKLI